MATRMQQRRGTAAQWISTNSGNGPILSAGEIGFESDTNKFKIGDGVNHWVDLTYFTDADSIMSAIASLTDGAPELLNTLNELAAAIGDNPNFFNDYASKDYVASAVSGATVDQSALAGVGIDWNASSEQFDIDSTVATKTYADGAVSTAVSALTKSSVGLGNVDNTSDANKPVSTATQTALDLKAPKANPTFTGTVNAADLTLSGNLTVNGTTTTVNSTAVNVNNQVIFEGATADAYETTLTVVDPTADRTISLPDTTGTLATEDYVQNVVTGNAPDYGTLVGSGLQYADGKLKLDNSYAGEVAMDAVAGAFNSGTGLQHNYDDVANTLTIDIDATVATKTYADDAVSTHNSDSTSVHGISDTSKLVTTDDTGTVTSTMIANGTIVNADINASAAIAQSKVANLTSDLAAKALGSDLTAHTGATTSVHGIADTAALSTKTYADGKASDAQTAAQGYADTAISTAVAALTKSSVGLGNVDNTSDANKPVSTATQTALDLKAPKANPTFTGTVTLPANTITNSMLADDAVDTAEIKDAAVTNAKLAGSIDWTKLSVSSTVSSTELGYVDGVTSAIQTQLDAKLALAGGTMTGALTLSGAPSADLHAATKAYVDNVVAGINFHQPVRVATTGNITLSGTQTIDGVSLSVGDRVLVKDQSNQKNNGIYEVKNASWSRSADADNTPEGELAGGDFCLVLEGTVNAGYGYVCSNTSAITIGTSDITYAPFNAAKAVTAGSGLTESTPGTLDIATGGVTSAMIADGTIVNGDISSSAAIAASKISGTAVTQADTGTVTSTMIADGTIVNADINASAAIAQSKISGLTSDLAAKAPLADPTFTGTVTVASAGVAFTDGTQSKEGVPSRTPIIQKTASYTLSSLTERDSLIEVASSSGTTITIPTNSAVAYPVGTSIDILQTSTGQVTIAGDTGVTVNATPGLKLRTTWSSATLFKRAANTWVVYGDLTA